MALIPSLTGIVKEVHPSTRKGIKYEVVLSKESVKGLWMEVELSGEDQVVLIPGECDLKAGDKVTFNAWSQSDVNCWEAEGYKRVNF